MVKLGSRYPIGFIQQLTSEWSQNEQMKLPIKTTIKMFPFQPFNGTKNPKKERRQWQQLCRILISKFIV